MAVLLGLTVLATLVALLYGPISRELTVIGVFRTPARAVIEHGKFYKIFDTKHCEDVHLYGGKLFAACESSTSVRHTWFPPVALFTQAPQTTGSESGSIHVIDPMTMKSTRLEFENFSGQLITHGIDVIGDPVWRDAVYIFAVNHLPNPDFYTAAAESGGPPKSEDVHKARSQIELFHHVLGSSRIRHVRSIYHPLIKTPNDIYAESPTSFYVTNDHFYREGFMRHVEDMIPAAKWSNIVHVRIHELRPDDDGSEGSDVDVTMALTGLHSNNGLGHGASADEMLIDSALGGIMYRARPNDNRTISIVDSVQLDSLADNPSYFQDPYGTAENDRSGYIVAGLARAIDLPKTFTDPTARDGVMVWLVRPNTTERTGWEKKLIFEDDGENIRTASAAVLVATEPRGGSRKAWLFVTGFLSENMIAAEVDL